MYIHTYIFIYTYIFFTCAYPILLYYSNPSAWPAPEHTAEFEPVRVCEALEDGEVRNRPVSFELDGGHK